MGKKNLRNKYKNKTKTNEYEEDIEKEDNFNNFQINESYIILQKLASTDYNERENITALLASQEFGANDEKMKEQLVNSELCRVLAEKILDPFIQVRFNAITAIINLIICYSEYDIDAKFLFEAKLLNYIENLLNEYLNNIKINFKYTEGEQAKINKLMKSAVDLLLLVIELYDTDSSKNYNKLDFNIIIKLNVEFILNPGFLSEEVIINSCLFLSNLLSLKVIQIEDNSGNNLKNLADFAFKIVSDKVTFYKANPVVSASFACSLFYIYCNNFSLINNPEFVKYLIDTIYAGINFNLGSDIDTLNMLIQNYIKTCNSEEGVMIVENSEKEKQLGKTTSILKDKMKSTEYSIRSTLLFLKTFTDVINSVELKTNSNSNCVNNYEGLDEDEDFKEDEMDTSDKSENENEVEKNISHVVNKIFAVTDYQPLYVMLKNDFLPNLINFFDKLTIEEFLLNDFDKMIVIKELLYDLEFFTISLINNTLQNYEGLFNENFNLVCHIAASVNKRLQIGEYSKNQDFLSVLLTCLRTVLEKSKNINDNLEQKIDYRSLFVILNNNLNDTFIKITIVDTNEDNLEICKLLFNICDKESDLEVVSHCLNAYFDIFKEDDIESNLNLRQVGVIEGMKIGAKPFKTRMIEEYKTKQLDRTVYDYVKETLLNLNRFVKYKEKLFSQLKI